MFSVSNKKEKMASIGSNLTALKQTEKQAYKIIQSVLNELNIKYQHHTHILLIFYFIKPMVHLNPFKQTVGNSTNRQSMAYVQAFARERKRMSSNFTEI
jgi:hypothetical protein